MMIIMPNRSSMHRILLLPLSLILTGGESDTGRPSVPPPARGSYYHGVFPGAADGGEATITEGDVREYEALAGSRASIICFSSEWKQSRAFPRATVAWIRNNGAIPYIRLMLRSSVRLRQREPVFTLKRILSGEFDDDLRAWSAGARESGGPILAEYGTEVNGDWFPWNATWNDPFPGTSGNDRGEYSGATLFRRAYRHIIAVCRSAGASNISWVFHVNSRDAPVEPWNRMEKYYPGSGWVDWMGVSVYGAQTPADPEWPSFRSLMDSMYTRLSALDPAKPVLVAEFGVTAGHQGGDQAAWAEAALRELRNGRWPTVAGFVWWNGSWENTGFPRSRTTMRLSDNPDLARAFRRALAGSTAVPEPASLR
jgi:hypothetical protein